MRALRHSGRYFVGTWCGRKRSIVRGGRAPRDDSPRVAGGCVTSFLWSTMAAVCFWGAI